MRANALTGKPLKPWEKFSYTMGAVGREASNNMINTFFMLYLTVFVKLNPIIVGFALFAAKVWDAFNDPMLATLINNTKSKKLGKFKPWIIAGTLLNCIIIIFMFFPINTESIGIKYFYYFFMYILWGMTFTIVDVPFWSMIPSIANTTKERNSVSSLSKLIGGFGGMAAGSGGTGLIASLPQGSNNPYAYFIVACAVSVLFVAVMSVFVCFTREKYELPQNDIKIKEVFRIFKNNDQLRYYAISYVFATLGIMMALVQPIYLFVYDYTRLPMMFFIVFNIVSCAGQGIFMLFYPLIVKKIPREKIYSLSYFFAMIGTFLSFLSFFVMLQMDVAQGANPTGKAITYGLINVLILSLTSTPLMIANGISQIGSTVMISDVVDYEEFKTGKRSDSVIFSIQTLIYKFACALAVLILSFGIQAAGLPSMEQSVSATGEAVYQFEGLVTNEILIIFRTFMFLVPIPLTFIGWIVYKKGYKLYGTTYNDMMVVVKDRRKRIKTQEANREISENPYTTTLDDVSALKAVIKKETSYTQNEINDISDGSELLTHSIANPSTYPDSTKDHLNLLSNSNIITEEAASTLSENTSPQSDIIDKYELDDNQPINDTDAKKSTSKKKQ